MKICKIQNGLLSQLFIPEEANGQGWRKFSSNINRFFITKNGQREVRTGKGSSFRQYRRKMRWNLKMKFGGILKNWKHLFPIHRIGRGKNIRIGIGEMH